VAVLGLGAIGSLVALRTGAVGIATERSVETVRAHGLRLEQGGATTVARVDAVERLATPVPLLVVAVKAYQLEQALDRVAPEAIAGALVLPLLNGLEHVDTLRDSLARRCGESPQGPPRVAAGSIGRVEAVSPEPGVVVQRTEAEPVITAASGELDRQSLDAALDALRVIGLEVVVADDERAVLWEKAARLAVLAAATTASGRSVGVLRVDPEWRGRLLAALEEAVTAAAADGVPLSFEAQWAIIESMPSDLTTSTARDAAGGRPTELDAITGSVVRAGRRLGVATPALATLLEEASCRAP
jgi:2-dehydropantoate 2-reductase